MTDRDKMIEALERAADPRWTVGEEGAVSPPTLTSEQIDHCLKIGSAEAAANLEYRSGRYDPETGGPALARLNELRRTAPPASPSAPHSSEVQPDEGKAGPAEISRPEAVQAPYTTPEKALPAGLVWCPECGAMKGEHQHRPWRSDLDGRPWFAV